MLSFLAIQEVRLQARFAEKFPGAFLIWEPGSWLPPGRGVQQTISQTPSTDGGRGPTHSDALAFHLGDEQGATITVGRSPENDCAISDATVGRAHLLLTRHADGWAVRAVGGRAVTFRGQPLVGERRLSPGDSLQVGHVTLTFGDAGTLTNRFRGLSVAGV